MGFARLIGVLGREGFVPRAVEAYLVCTGGL